MRTTAEISQHIVTALCYVDPAKYGRSVANPEGTVTVIAGDEVILIENVRDFATEAQGCYQEIWEKNQSYPDQAYLACVAFVNTFNNKKKAYNGGSATAA